jgi:hypothetical protein
MSHHLKAFLKTSGLAILLISFSLAEAQRKKAAAPSRVGSSIVDDSTKTVYGPATTLWTTEKDLFDNRPNYRPLDTAVNNYDRWTHVQKYNNFYKDLGVMGTSMSPIFPEVPSVIGATIGFTTYDLYYNSAEPHYFNTKSPYSRMQLIWGGNGRAMTQIEFSRNINPRWNFGFNYRPILIDKQLQRKGKGDQQTTSQYYDFFTTYASKDTKYFLLFSFRRMKHQVAENGGVALPPGGTYKDFFDPLANINLLAAKTEAFRSNLHLLQQYQLSKAFQIYYVADYTEQSNAFSDDVTQEPPTYYDHFEKVNSDTTKSLDRAVFYAFQQEGGIKGNASKLFYSAYYKVRNYNYSNVYLKDIELSVAPSGIENYVGGRLSLKLDSVTEITGAAEYLLPGYYRVEGRIQSPWLDASFVNSLSKPGMMQMVYRGSHDYWNHSYVGINSTQAKGFLKLNTNALQLAGGMTFNLLHNYVYFKEAEPADPTDKQRVLPYQSSGNQSTLAPEIRGTVKFLRHLYFRPQAIYTTFITNDDNALSIPQLFLNGQLTYEKMLFEGHLQMQLGVNVHWQSTYYATAYDPAIQQFYIQHTMISPSFPITDLFFNGKMRRGRFFVKYNNFGQIFSNVGYMPTPLYPITRPMIDFGFDFLLFD